MPPDNHDVHESRPRREFSTPPNLLDDSADDYIADLMSAWRIDAEPEALRQIAADVEPTALIDCVRYALIRTSLNSAAARYVPELVKHAVETELWTADRALKIAAYIPVMGKRATLYTLLLTTDKLSDDERTRIQSLNIAAIFSITEDTQWHPTFLGKLAPYLSRASLDQVMEASPAIADKADRVKSWAAIIPYLDEERTKTILVLALDTVATIEDENDRFSALSTLLPFLSDEARQTITIQEIEHLSVFDNAFYRYELASLAPYLSEKLLIRALEIAYTIEHSMQRARTLVALTRKSGGAPFEEAVNHWIDVAFAIPPEVGRSSVLSNLLSTVGSDLNEETLLQILNVALTFTNERSRASLLSAILPYATTSILAQIKDAASQKFTDQSERAYLLASIVPYVAGEERERLIRKTFETILLSGMHPARLNPAFVKLSPYLNDEFSRFLIDLITKFYFDYNCPGALTTLIPHMDAQKRNPVLHQLLDTIISIRTEFIRAYALADLAPYVTGDLLAKVLDFGIAMTGDWDRARILVSLAPYLTSDLLPRALNAVFLVTDEVPRINVRTAFLPRLDNSAREAMLSDELNAVLISKDESYRSHALLALAPHLPDHLLARALETFVPSDEWSSDMLSMLDTLSPYLTGELLLRGVELVRTVTHTAALAGIWATFASSLTGEQRQEAIINSLNAMRLIENEDSYSLADFPKFIAKLAPYLTGDLLIQAWDILQALNDEDLRIEGLIALIPYLTGDLLDRGLSIARTIKEDSARLRTLIVFLAVIAAQQPADHPALIREIRTLIVTLLRDSEHKSRADVLDLLVTENLFAPPIVSESTITAIVEQIREICLRWPWGQPATDFT